MAVNSAGRRAARWEFELDIGGSTIALLKNATGRSLTFTRNTWAEAQATIFHEDPAAQKLMDALANGHWPSLRCWRWGPTDTTGQLRFRGYLAPFSESLDESGSLSLTFRSPFWRLQGEGDVQGRFTPAWLNASAKDAGAAAASLVQLYGGRADGVTGGADSNWTVSDATGAQVAATYQEASYAGLDIGNVAATVTRDLTYQYANVGESIVNLSAMFDGFDFSERFVDSGATLALFDVAAAQGGDKAAAKFEYGKGTKGNCSGVVRSWEPPINYVTLIGAYGLVSTQSNAGSISSYGKFPYQATRSDIFDQVALDRTAIALLRPSPVERISFTPDLWISPLPWDDFWLGDAVHFYGRRGSFVREAALRVNQITVPIDDEGHETTSISDPLSADDEAWTKATISTEVNVV